MSETKDFIETLQGTYLDNRLKTSDAQTTPSSDKNNFPSDFQMPIEDLQETNVRLAPADFFL
jgi:hypothetical protein